MGDLSFIFAAIAAFVAVAGVGIAFTGNGNKRQAQRMQVVVGAPLQAGKRQTSALDQTAQKKAPGAGNPQGSGGASEGRAQNAR